MARSGEAQMWYNPEGDELDPAVDDCRRCKNNSSTLSYIDKKTMTVAVSLLIILLAALVDTLCRI